MSKKPYCAMKEKRDRQTQKLRDTVKGRTERNENERDREKRDTVK